MDGIQFLDYLMGKFDLRKELFYTDDNDLVDALTNKTILSLPVTNHRINIPDEELKSLAYEIEKYMKAYHDDDIFDLFKNNPNVEEYEKYLEQIYFPKQTTNPYDLKSMIKQNKKVEYGVSKPVYREAISIYLVKHYPKNFPDVEFTRTILFNESNQPLGGPYKELAARLKMKFGERVIYDNLRCLYGRDMMSYGQDFKYNDIFTSNSDLKKQLSAAYPKIIIKVWTYNEDPSIVLIASDIPNIRAVITTVDMIREDIAHCSNKNKY